MSRRSRRRDASFARRRKIDRPTLLKQAKRNARLRPLAIAIFAVALVTAAGAVSLAAPLAGVVAFLSGAMLAVALWAASPMSCPSCGTTLVVEGERGFLRAPATVECTKCRVKGHPRA